MQNKGKNMFSQKDAPVAGETIAIIKTNVGDMKLRLFSEKVKEGVLNFTELAKAGSYKDVPFHRIISGFMIQGGDFTNKNGTGGHSYKGAGTTIADCYDAELSHIRGALSYAKTAAPKSIGSQFFIVHPKQGAHFLDHPAHGGPAEGYTVFGQVYEGFDVLDAIAETPTDGRDQPREPRKILDIVIEVA
jgi:cyclophilin family peptidyl-prolyl cis-trans isomerase